MFYIYLIIFQDYDYNEYLVGIPQGQTCVSALIEAVILAKYMPNRKQRDKFRANT